MHICREQLWKIWLLVILQMKKGGKTQHRNFSSKMCWLEYFWAIFTFPLSLFASQLPLPLSFARSSEHGCGFSDLLSPKDRSLPGGQPLGLGLSPRSHHTVLHTIAQPSCSQWVCSVCLTRWTVNNLRAGGHAFAFVLCLTHNREQNSWMNAWLH